MIEIRQGDCRDVLAELEAESFSACVTDPPYGIAFMSRRWDAPANVAFRPETWAAVHRVLKPGAHLLAMGGTRTFHRLVCAIEDAGFEIRDTIMWLYGCLSEDTEILVDGQWEPYHSAIAGRRALCYDANHDEYSWHPIQDLYVYDYDDTAFRIRSDRTDQIVSRNHRCLVERGGTLVFELAEEAARQRQARVPILEDLQGLLDSVSMPDQGAGSSQCGLWAGVPNHQNESATASAAYARTFGNGFDFMRGLRQGRMATAFLAEADQDTCVLAEVQRDASRQGMGQARAQGASGMVSRSRGTLAAKDDWRGEPSLEGRSDVLPQGWALQADQVRALPTRVSVDGAEGWLRDGAPVDRGAGDRAMPTQDRSCPSRRPRSASEWANQSDAVREQSRSQAVRASRFTRTDLARVEPVHYRGIVWCVRVPTGAFVARRNGKVFVTGNSGFPKSHDVSKAIDRAASAEREVVGPRIRVDGQKPGIAGSINGIYQGFGKSLPTSITAPATDAAREWQGWGTSLKPAAELICVARKPLSEGTVAANVLRHGTGALNIDASRVVTGESTARSSSGIRNGSTLNCSADGSMRTPGIHGGGEGRWPANVCQDGSPEVLEAFERFGEGNRCGAYVRGGGSNSRQDGWGYASLDGKLNPCYGDTGTAARFFYTAKADSSERVGSGEGRWPANVCQDGSPEVLEAFARFGERNSRDPEGQTRKTTTVGANPFHGNNVSVDEAWRKGAGLGDGGTAARFFFCGKADASERVGSHPTVKPVALMEWLVRLITPPNGRVIDPFCGTGSTLVACDRLGFDALGIEQDAQTVADAHEKLRRMRARRMIGDAEKPALSAGQLRLEL